MLRMKRYICSGNSGIDWRCGAEYLAGLCEGGDVKRAKRALRRMFRCLGDRGLFDQDQD